MSQGPRIYNLFPLLAGSVRDWEAQLPRIAAMGFDWVFLNPFHYPGFSGSLYAVKDYYRLHLLFQGHSRKPQDELLREFVGMAGEHGLSVMMDLVINHTAKDSELTVAHPEWFAHEADGSLRSPLAVDPDDPAKKTVWGDLAEIDYEGMPDREGLVAWWQELVRHYTGLGFRGFRCDAAYKVPGGVWAEVIGATRALNPEAHFFAETLGCQPPEVAQLHEAGFDYLFNSGKWWGFHAGWLLEQYESYRRIAPSVGFPESHDTERLAAESGGDERISRLRYLFAAFFSAGVMMPMGFEFGFRRKLDVVKTRPDDWEEPLFDLSGFVRAANLMKAGVPVLNEEGTQERFTPPRAPLVGLVRRGVEAPGVAAALVNSDPGHRHDCPRDHLAEAMGVPPGAIREITPLHPPEPPGHGRIHVAPLEMRVFVAEAENVGR
jgi:starch synthase (maltosyl-transferring)